MKILWRSRSAFLIPALLTLSGCGEGPERSVAFVPLVADSAGITIVTHPAEAIERPAPLRLGDSPAVRIGAITGSEEMQFVAIVGAHRLSDGSFAVLDRQLRTIRIFDEEGNFVRAFGGAGQGPGEFNRPTHLFASPDGTLLVWDPPRRFTAFDLDGFLRLDDRFVPPAGQVALLSASFLADRGLLTLWEDNSPVFENLEETFSSAIGHLTRLTREGGADSIGTIPGSVLEVWVSDATGASGGPAAIQVLTLPAWYRSQLLAAATPEGVWTADGTSWEVLHRGAGDGEVNRIIRFRHPGDPFTREKIDELHARELEGAPNPGAFRERQATIVYPPTIPPIRELFADAEGRLWIGRTEIPFGDLPSNMGKETREWIVLSADGSELVGSVSLPPRSRLLYADLEGALLVAVDDFDVPYLEWWRFEFDS